MTALTGEISTFTQSQHAALHHELNIAIDTALALNRLVGAVTLVAHRGEIVYQRAAGFADREARKLMQLDTIFRLASVTKPIVSVAALALIEQGKLALKDPQLELSVVGLTNTTVEGMAGVFPLAIRDAIYRAIA